MKMVPRYDLVGGFGEGSDDADMHISPDGEWVRYHDHVAALEQARREATEAAFTEMRRRWDEAFGVKE